MKSSSQTEGTVAVRAFETDTGNERTYDVPAALVDDPEGLLRFILDREPRWKERGEKVLVTGGDIEGMMTFTNEAEYGEPGVWSLCQDKVIRIGRYVLDDGRENDGLPQAVAGHADPQRGAGAHAGGTSSRRTARPCSGGGRQDGWSMIE